MRLDVEQTTYDAITGLIFPTRLGVDLRAGAGAAITSKNQSLSGTINTTSKNRKTRFLGEAGLKFKIPLWGEVDLSYNNQGNNHYFIYESILPLFRGIALSSGYTYSPESSSHSRYFAWNVGLKAYF